MSTAKAVVPGGVGGPADSSDDRPWLVVGLGNPGPQYAGNRHNIGAMVLTQLAADLGDRFGRHRGQADVAEVRLPGSGGRPGPRLILAKPTSYMNVSGGPVNALSRFFRIEADHLLVVHDELDIPPGQLRLKFGGGLGGHNGLKDITAHLGTQDYWRLRIGIGHPGDRNEVVNYVLKPPRREERDEIDPAIGRALELWPLIQAGDWNSAVKRANTKPASPLTPQSSPRTS